MNKNINFFSNSLLFVDGKVNETVESLPNTRPAPTSTFDVPLHTIDTTNLLVFVNGMLQTKDYDYQDISSSQIRFNRSINEVELFKAVLIKTDNSNGSGNVGTSSQWEEF